MSSTKAVFVVQNLNENGVVVFGGDSEKNKYGF